MYDVVELKAHKTCQVSNTGAVGQPHEINTILPVPNTNNVDGREGEGQLLVTNLGEKYKHFFGALAALCAEVSS